MRAGSKGCILLESKTKTRSNKRQIACLMLLVAMVLFAIGAASCICDLAARREVAPAFAVIKTTSEGIPTEDGSVREGVDKFRPMADSQGGAALLYRIANLKLESVRLSGDCGTMLVSYDLEAVREGEVVGVNRNQAAEVLLEREMGSWSIADVDVLL